MPESAILFRYGCLAMLYQSSCGNAVNIFVRARFAEHLDPPYGAIHEHTTILVEIHTLQMKMCHGTKSALLIFLLATEGFGRFLQIEKYVHTVFTECIEAAKNRNFRNTTQMDDHHLLTSNRCCPN